MVTFDRSKIGKKSELANRSKREYIPFDIGAQKAKIIKINEKKTKKKDDMFQIILANDNNQSGIYNLPFVTSPDGTDFGEMMVQRLLASIQDASEVEIPGDVDFGFTPATQRFLKGKTVYIEVIEEEWNGTSQPKIDLFLTQEEFDHFDDDFDEELGY